MIMINALLWFLIKPNYKGQLGMKSFSGTYKLKENVQFNDNILLLINGNAYFIRCYLLLIMSKALFKIFNLQRSHFLHNFIGI